MKVAELFVKCLEEQGIKYIFGVPGEENIDLLDAIHGSSIQFVVCRHETGAAFIAGVLGKLTGTPGVSLSTLGPGATNMMTGVAAANLDRMPLIAITAQKDTTMQYDGVHQYLNVMAMYRPITKWGGVAIQNETNLPKAINDAFISAVSEPPGAIHIELPNDLASMETSEQPLQLIYSDEQRKEAQGSFFESVAIAINQAKFPLVFIGRGAINKEIGKAILPFIEKLKAPFTETFMAKGVVPGNHPLHLQTAGLTEGDFVNHAFLLSDLIVTIGYDSIEYGAKKWNEKLTPVIHIGEVAPSRTDQFYPIKAMLTGDIAQNLEHLIKYVQEREDMNSNYRQLKEIIRNDLGLQTTSQKVPLAPQRIVKEIREVLSPEDILVSDVGAHKLWIGRQYEAYAPNTCIISDGLASMGIGIPGAIGAKLARPDKKVIAAIGDGAFIMSLADFETAVRLKLAIVFLVWRDGRFGAIEWGQKNKLSRSSGVEFDNPDFQQLAESYGTKGYKVHEANHLAGILQEALEESGPVVVECPVDYTENFRLSERLILFKKGLLG